MLIDYEGETVCCGGEDSLISRFRTPLPHPQGSFYRYSDAAYYLLACHGVWEGRRLLSKGYIQQMQANERGLPHFRDSELYVKAGAYGQGVAFSCRRPLAAAWHRSPYAVRPVPDRNGVMLERLERLIAQENQ